MTEHAQKKDQVARLLADRLNYKSKADCKTTEQADDWYSEYGRVINVLDELEKMDQRRIVKFSYNHE